MLNLLFHSCLFLGIAILSAIITRLSISLARRRNILAHPVGRSSHNNPTPQLGGIGICGSFIIAMILLSVFPGLEIFALQTSIGQFVWSLFVIILIGFLVGLIDDIFTISPLTKLTCLMVLAFTPFFFDIYFPLSDITVAKKLVCSYGFCSVVLIAWLIFFINGYNFMDGVNGQSAVYAANALFWFGLIVFWNKENYHFAEEIFWIIISLGAALIGFLPYNFPNARTFMGDSGALPVGGALALMTVFLSNGKFGSFIGFSIVLSVYIYDVIFTLIRRALRGENVLMAHRSHLYQRLLVATGWSHARLLFFHSPFYLLTGMASFTFFILEDIYFHILILIGVLLLLFLYTFLVLRAEKRKINIGAVNVIS